MYNKNNSVTHKNPNTKIHRKQVFEAPRNKITLLLFTNRHRPTDIALYTAVISEIYDRTNSCILACYLCRER